MEREQGSRFTSWLLILLGIAGVFGLWAWYGITTFNALQQTNRRWVERVSMMASADQQTAFDLLSSSVRVYGGDLRRIAASSSDAVALFLTDEGKPPQHWFKESSYSHFEPFDPRLGVLQVKVLQTGKAQSGPVLTWKNAFYTTAVYPVDPNRTVIAILQNHTLLPLLDEQCDLWHVRAAIFDADGNAIYSDRRLMPSEPFVREAALKARAGSRSGWVFPRSMAQGMRWFYTYQYDPTTDWIFVVGQSAYWLYLPMFFLGIVIVGLALIIRVPYYASTAAERKSISHALATFAGRVDRYVRGRDTALNDPPYPYQELMPVVTALRWMMPQWKQAEVYPKEFGLERKLLALLIESLPEGILFFNAQGGLQTSNELGRVFYTLNQDTSKEPRSVNGVQIASGFMEQFLEPVMSGEQMNIGKEIEVDWADGKHLYRVWVEKVQPEEGKATGYIAVIRDITFRKQWETVQEQMMSGITHDLRGPLSALMGYIDLSRKQAVQASTPKLEEYLKLAKEAGLRLNQMVSDILDVVRFEQGKVDIQVEAIPVAQIMERLRNTFGVLAEQKQIELKIQMVGDASMKVFADHKLLDRVLDNLTGNAIKFTPSKGTITIRAQRLADRVHFEVADTGRGIPREAQSRIFDKYQQVRPGDRSAGYGLGLAVAKFIVEAHKGSIRVESEVGVGSKFALSIPDQNVAIKLSDSPASGGQAAA